MGKKKRLKVIRMAKKLLRRTMLMNDEVPQVVKDIIERLKQEEGLTYADAYGILQITKEYLEYKANFLAPIVLTKQINCVQQNLRTEDLEKISNELKNKLDGNINPTYR